MSLNDLPLDILSTIFSFFEFTPCIRAVSVVCRRWRTAALRSITSLELAALEAPTAAAISRLPCLTRLSIEDRATDGADKCIRLPHTLRELVVSFTPAALVPAGDHPLPSLLLLEATLDADVAPDVWAPLTAASRTSLTSLALRGAPQGECAKLMEIAAEAHFPALTHIETTADLSDAIARRHASQLTSMRCNRLPSGPLVYPNLCSLWVGHMGNTPLPEALATVAPRLTELKGLFVETLYNTPGTPAAFRAVRELDLSTLHSSALLLPEIHRMPNLTSLLCGALAPQDLEELLLHPDYAAMIRSLGIALPLRAISTEAHAALHWADEYNDAEPDDFPNDIAPQVFQLCTNLRQLTLYQTDRCPLAYPSPLQSLPLLERLELESDSSDLDALVACANAYLDRCPRLSQLVLSYDVPFNVHHQAQLNSLLARMTHRRKPMLCFAVTAELQAQRIRTPAESYSWVFTYVVESKAGEEEGADSPDYESYGERFERRSAGSEEAWERAWDEDLEDH